MKFIDFYNNNFFNNSSSLVESISGNTNDKFLIKLPSECVYKLGLLKKEKQNKTAMEVYNALAKLANNVNEKRGLFAGIGNKVTDILNSINQALD